MISLYSDLINKKSKLSVIGMGYVGMPIAIAFAKKIEVIGFDISQEKIALYCSGFDPTKEVGDEEVKQCKVEFTSDETKLQEARFHIVAVPTPVNADHTPNLFPMESASRMLGKNLTKGSVVVYESTVYPGVTEEICKPILEKESGLTCGPDFKIGYSPERINPGDKIHRLESITKIVSGMDDETLKIIAKVYELVVKAGVHRVDSIKVAEAAKVIENSQRDINIAFMNELSIIYSQVILSGRRINDDMGKYVAESLIKNLIKAGATIKNARVAILGFTFKENCPDVRNTRVIDIVKELKEYEIDPFIFDPVADHQEVKKEYGITLCSRACMNHMDAILLAVGHDIFKQINRDELDLLYRKDSQQKRILLDIKGLFNKNEYEQAGYLYWRL